MKTKLYLDSIFIQFVNKRERSQSNEFAYLFIIYSLPLVNNYRPLLLGLAQTFENREKERRKKRST